MIGRTAHIAIAGDVFTSFIGHHTEYRSAGYPITRMRKFINGRELATPSHARMIRRWKNNGVTVTQESAAAVLRAYGLTLADFTAWCAARTITPTIRGELG
jgi:hypothetical protein